MNLYPIKFKPILKERVWGGEQLSEFKSLKKAANKIGESWEISPLHTDLSVAANGFLKGNTIEELVEVYMGDLVGEKVYEKFGVEFPLLFKFINSSEPLSLQVHPNDTLALERHYAYGKTEMWYTIAAGEESNLYAGFKKEVSPQSFAAALSSGAVMELVNAEHAKPGDVFFLPPGCIHAIGKGILLAEIQQASDITYRIYDWGRENNPKTAREMHVELAMDAIDYSQNKSCKAPYEKRLNSAVQLNTNPYFTANLLEINRPVERDYYENDSFTVYMCISGSCSISYGGGKESLSQGETVLIPAAISNLELQPNGYCKLLEVYAT